MASGNWPDYKLNLDGLGQLNLNQARSANTSGTSSPLEPPAGTGIRYPLGNGLGSGSASQTGTGRAGAGSPSKDFGARLFSKRAREIQAQEGLSPQVWGPPPAGSGHSTPLRETIPESPVSDNFPDFDNGQLDVTAAATTPTATRRTRAGTVPSRFPGISSMNNSSTSLPMKQLSRPPSSTSLYQGMAEQQQQVGGGTPMANHAALLSRLRAGSMPQRTSLLPTNPFGSSLFASSWMAGRERASTLQSIRSSDAPSSPRESPADNDVRTLDYLGLVDTPTLSRNSMSQAELDFMISQQRQNGQTIADLAALNAFNNKNTANRFRSYSVNATEKYADGEEEASPYDAMQQYYATGQLTPSAEVTAAQAAAIHEAVRQHNLEVQAFANFASANRPRARTAGVLDSPSSRVLRTYLPTPSRLDNSISASDLQSDDASDFGALNASMQSLGINARRSYEAGPESNMETPTRALWLGNIPASTTVSSLNVIFGQFGHVEFARILTHKSCGFVNFENVQSAIAAKAQCNGKEIFPGCGPIRIGFAKEQSNTPGPNGTLTSPSPDPMGGRSRGDSSAQAGGINAETAAAALATPDLSGLRDEVAHIVQQFGATHEEQSRISENLERSMSYNGYLPEILPIPEPTHNRIHDAPRLREIRKRIDNNACTPAEIEAIAMEMLPEIAELSSDYLGNTVVQKLFEHCSEDTKEAMLTEIAPHLAEIGVHKNGTWAAQKIIDVARTPRQMSMIVEALSPHSVNLFLDQYGNYVMQCCLRFQSPSNNFIFDTMLNKLWDVAQGRFGARAMRACLESHFATNDQKRLMAAGIALHSVQLATNSNGALLLTWFLDTCAFPRRRSVLAPRLVPHLVHLCTHKVAYLTVLKIINQRNEPDARDSLLRALFFDEQTLTDIVSDQSCGATLIFKVLTTPFLDDAIRPECLEKVRKVLLQIKAQPTQGYKRLMDEVGLSARHGSNPIDADGRLPSKARNGQDSAIDGSQPTGNYGRPQGPGPASQRSQHDRASQHVAGVDPNGFDPYSMSSQYTHSPGASNPGANAMNPQLQYQQAMMAQAQAQVQRNGGMYAGLGGMPHNGLPFNGSPTGPAQPGLMDAYRHQTMAGGMGAPLAPPGLQGGFQAQQQTFNGGMNANGYGAPPQYQMSNPYFHQQQQQQGGLMTGGGGGGGRRGRR